MGGCATAVVLCVAVVLAAAAVMTPRLIRSRAAGEKGVVVDYGVWTTVASVPGGHGHHVEGVWSSCEFVHAAGESADVHRTAATTSTRTPSTTHTHAVAAGLSLENVTNIVIEVLEEVDDHDHGCVFCFKFMPASQAPYVGREHTHAGDSGRARARRGSGGAHAVVAGTLNVTGRCAHVLVSRCRVSQVVSVLGIVLAALAASVLAAGCVDTTGGLAVGTLAQMSAGFLWSTCVIVDSMLAGSVFGDGCSLDAGGGDPNVSAAYVMLWVSAVVAQLAACWLVCGAWRRPV